MTSPGAPSSPSGPARNARVVGGPAKHFARAPRRYLVAIGVDKYAHWPRLNNAVADARGAIDAFFKLGFEPLPTLFDHDATGIALRELASDGPRMNGGAEAAPALGPDDSLVVFFAGHGHTVERHFVDGTSTKNGYLIPCDGDDAPTGRSASWVDLAGWLSGIARLPPRHILVILDACHSGIALDPVIRWRGADLRSNEAFERLGTRRSRRILTSAQDDQRALDSGPRHGHSLFTGCLIDALAGGAAGQLGRPQITGSELALHVQRRVAEYPHSQQTPDFGALELDNRGELIFRAPEVEVKAAPADPASASNPRGVSEIYPRGGGPPSRTDQKPTLPAGVAGIMPRRPATAPGVARTPSDDATSAKQNTEPKIERPEVVDAPHEPPVEPPIEPLRIAPLPRRPPPTWHKPPQTAFDQMLNQHHKSRKAGKKVLSIIVAEPTAALAGWATWSARQGSLTLVTEGTGTDATISDLLRQTPWLRTLPSARDTLAASAGVSTATLDRELGRSDAERDAWLDEISHHDQKARVSAWLLTALRAPCATGPELPGAPVSGGELLSTLGKLDAPISILLHNRAPTAPWLERALAIASEVADLLPRHAIAVAAPRELLERVLDTLSGTRIATLASHGQVPLAKHPAHQLDLDRKAVSATLHDALANDPRTAQLFEHDVSVPTHQRVVEVDLVARDALLAVAIDDWYRFNDPDSYRRDRVKELELQRAGFFVTRFLAEDIEARLGHVVDEIALGIGARCPTEPETLP